MEWRTKDPFGGPSDDRKIHENDKLRAFISSPHENGLALAANDKSPGSEINTHIGEKRSCAPHESFETIVVLRSLISIST